ncbi:pyridine nucleotide-disulfide oxidoreductase family protein [Klebsiella pneumoniae]|uniref:Pyridine nucleotide-disulfide oxidoreductase family protein n=1 Tax=Klebsiella pneumoniae TaxID=573 RepID=A0A377XC08_KLEPN|nr:pyridine nucleotide-disulfide oxidoreductase family protein [Klebsiella pneumoniae]
MSIEGLFTKKTKEAMNHFILSDSRKCIGCQACEVACVMAHNEEQHVLTPQRFLPRITVIKAEGQRNAITCRHCEDAPCVRSCPQRRHRPVRRQRSGPSGEMHWL